MEKMRIRRAESRGGEVGGAAKGWNGGNRGRELNSHAKQWYQHDEFHFSMIIRWFLFKVNLLNFVKNYTIGPGGAKPGKLWSKFWEFLLGWYTMWCLVVLVVVFCNSTTQLRIALLSTTTPPPTPSMWSWSSLPYIFSLLVAVNCNFLWISKILHQANWKDRKTDEMKEEARTPRLFLIIDKSNNNSYIQ